MCYLKHFWYCMHLYTGVLIIGISGVLVAILSATLVAIKVYPEVILAFFILAVIFITFYLLSKLLLLMGATQGSKRMIFGSFIIIIICLIYPICLCIWAIVFKDDPLKILLLIYFITMELYYAWVVFSYWNVVRNCCKDNEIGASV